MVDIVSQNRYWYVPGVEENSSSRDGLVGYDAALTQLRSGVRFPFFVRFFFLSILFLFWRLRLNPDLAFYHRARTDTISTFGPESSITRLPLITTVSRPIDSAGRRPFPQKWWQRSSVFQA